MIDPSKQESKPPVSFPSLYRNSIKNLYDNERSWESKISFGAGSANFKRKRDLKLLGKAESGII